MFTIEMFMFVSYNTQQRETYEARIEEMEIQSVNNSKEMKNVTHDMKTVNTTSFNSMSFILKC